MSGASDKGQSELMVSCLMVTSGRAGRFAYFRRAVADYCRQSHRNRELVVVFDQCTDCERAAILGHVDMLNRRDIRVIAPDGKLSLGALRNLSCISAHGDIFCQWDDDDWHHPERIRLQLQALIDSGAEAICLENAMHYVIRESALYCTNWRATPAKGLPCTLICRKSASFRYPESGPESVLGEDLAVSLQLQQRGLFRTLAGAAHLYVYVNHGGNSWGDDHHRMLIERLAVSGGLLRRGERELRAGLAAFDFGTGTITVQGSNGPAFILRPPAHAAAPD